MSCPGCGPNTGRREFLRDLAAIAAVAAGVSGHSGPGDEVTYPVPAQDGVSIDKAREVILVRHEQAVYAFALSCPHQKTPLRWQEAQDRFQCPKHKSTFRPDGAFVEGRATRNMDRYAIRRDGANVVVGISTLYREDEHREKWLSAVVRL